MTQPMDPNDYGDDSSEYSWGPGLFPPGIADNEGQRLRQDDFGEKLPTPTEHVGDFSDNYARAVADRRTDSTDPTSGRDFETLGNPDRFGPNPALVQANPERNKSQRTRVEQDRLKRKG
ncbi:hypothetical protein HWB51_gp086 [Mycobacterium phage Cuke]|uniref:Uncharacterized protein n=1 Tax=Mycobacterium phage Cuke TaxID=2079417 RepID=A0A2L1IX32_9CAUD|nr:hypothetical protein HWB51_gp086 [Mycobacterium phage Cuke]AVD99726.1 hypothetical protein SEA_CUKE_110 [Mycobacterium phage Cuke]